MVVVSASPGEFAAVEPSAIVSDADATIASITDVSTAVCGPVLEVLVLLAVVQSFVIARRSPAPLTEQRPSGGVGPARIRARAGRGWGSGSSSLLQGPCCKDRAACGPAACGPRCGHGPAERSGWPPVQRVICRAPPVAHARSKSAECPPRAPLGSAHWDIYGISCHGPASIHVYYTPWYTPGRCIPEVYTVVYTVSVLYTVLYTCIGCE